MRASLLTLLVATAFPAGAATQDPRANANARIEIPALLHVQVTSAVAVFEVTDPQSPGTAYAPMTSSPAILTTRANVPHQVHIHADGHALRGANGTPRSVHDVEWSIDGVRWTPLSTSPRMLLGDLRPGYHPALARLHFRLRLRGSRHDPGTYTAPFILSALPR